MESQGGGPGIDLNMGKVCSQSMHPRVMRVDGWGWNRKTKSPSGSGGESRYRGNLAGGFRVAVCHRSLATSVSVELGHSGVTANGTIVKPENIPGETTRLGPEVVDLSLYSDPTLSAGAEHGAPDSE